MLACVLLLQSPSALPGPGFDPDLPQVESRIRKGVLSLRGTFQVHSSGHHVWEVLTDYPHIPDFIKSIRRSALIERHQDSVVVEQEATAHALFLTETLHLRLVIHQHAPDSLVFQDTRHSDFELYQGEWRVAYVGETARVSYLLRAKPRTLVPATIAKTVLQKSAVELLTQVRSEIIRRTLSHASASVQ